MRPWSSLSRVKSLRNMVMIMYTAQQWKELNVEEKWNELPRFCFAKTNPNVKGWLDFWLSRPNRQISFVTGARLTGRARLTVTKFYRITCLSEFERWDSVMRKERYSFTEYHTIKLSLICPNLKFTILWRVYSIKGYRGICSRFVSFCCGRCCPYWFRRIEWYYVSDVFL